MAELRGKLAWLTRQKGQLEDLLHRFEALLETPATEANNVNRGNIAIISDVEKAFLQVHLQTCDRDATRCLWVHDITKPLITENTVTYRFTRVTFGLNCSPFLLGATIAEHLEHTEDRKMAALIKNNIYVDNLVITASSVEEAVQRCEKARRIFAEIGMNLREFRTNAKEVNDRLPSDKLSGSTTPKVLGLKWNSEKDTIDLECHYPDKTVVTKRTVSEQVAAVYDPLGWLTPLTVRAKIFLQSLWKHKYKWDQCLTSDHKNQWKHILSQIQGYTKHIPRKASDGEMTSPARLVAFADASKQAMAACVYLVHKGRSELLIAKSKLPSMKNDPTIPKLEMNALTMATRLVRVTAQALQHQLHIQSVIVYSDSEVAMYNYDPTG
ncbi:hypothetical protein Q1695_008712 [Nippostrongylus brasiliensis]|nr:hypothetical protein Q1695_008712 [Nippostrongylus brasiliensis]